MFIRQSPNSRLLALIETMALHHTLSAVCIFDRASKDIGTRDDSHLLWLTRRHGSNFMSSQSGGFSYCLSLIDQRSELLPGAS